MNNQQIHRSKLAEWYGIYFVLLTKFNAYKSLAMRQYVAKIGIVVIQTVMAVCVIALIRPKLLTLAPSLVGSIIVCIPLFVLNERYLSDKALLLHCKSIVEAWSVAKQRLATVAAGALLVLVVLFLPVIIRTLIE